MRIKGRTRTEFLLLLSAVAFLLCSHQVNSHEPVTTKVRFNKEVIRIFQDHCVACHHPGSTTDISLDTYTSARPWAKAFKEEILERRMPPFQTVRGFGSFEYDYQLTQHEIDQIVSWVDGGTPKGDEKDLPSKATQQWTGGEPGVVLPLQELAIPAGEGDEYLCVTVPTSLKQQRWVSAIEFRVENDTAFHCASFVVQLRNAGCENHPGYENSLGSWFPGQQVIHFPKGIGQLIPANSSIAVRVHYKKQAGTSVDHGSLALFFADGTRNRSVRTVALDTTAVIPAGAENFRVESTYTMPRSVEAISIRPLLFPLAKSIEVTALRPDGTNEVLVWARDSGYDWQPAYHFKNAIQLPKGTRIRTVAYLDNSGGNPNNPNLGATAVRLGTPLCELSFVNVAAKTR
jgi:hypothetical protein